MLETGNRSETCHLSDMWLEHTVMLVVRILILILIHYNIP